MTSGARRLLDADGCAPCTCLSQGDSALTLVGWDWGTTVTGGDVRADLLLDPGFC